MHSVLLEYGAWQMFLTQSYTSRKIFLKKSGRLDEACSQALYQICCLTCAMVAAMGATKLSGWRVQSTAPPPPKKNWPPNSADFADLFCRFVGFRSFADLFCRFVLPIRWESGVLPIHSADGLGFLGFWDT